VIITHGPFEIVNSVFSGNGWVRSGSGVSIAPSASGNLLNSTLSRNVSGTGGGLNVNGTVSLGNTTVARNLSLHPARDVEETAAGAGGGCEAVVEGGHRDLELQQVARGGAGLEPTEETIWRVLPGKPGDRVEVDGFDLTALLPAPLRSYRYPGSLTTPPCDQGVPWVLLAEPVEMSAQQIAAFQDLFLGTDRFPVGNARPVQPSNGRQVTTDAGGEPGPAAPRPGPSRSTGALFDHPVGGGPPPGARSRRAFKASRSFRIHSASCANFSSVVAGERNRVKTTSLPAPFATTRIG
jgi:hypothetical protein